MESAPVDHLALNQETEPSLSDEPLSDAIQWMTRRIEDFAEICEGHIRIEFLHGQREAAVHIAFCPPLCSVPEVELEDLDGCGWELKATAAYPYGLRITARRSSRQTAAESGRIAWWASAVRTEHVAA